MDPASTILMKEPYFANTRFSFTNRGRPSSFANDLSRGCNADEVYKMAIITAALV